jgi:hypothetical protein
MTAASSPSRPRGLATSPPNAAAPMGRRRRNLPLALFGLLTVVGCALAFAALSLATRSGQPVLMVVHDLPAGSVLTAADVATVRADVPATVHLVRESERSTIMGRPVGVPVAGRTLLTREVVAGQSFPESGSAVVGLALKAGRFPPSLVPGARIQAYRVAGDQQLPGQKPGGGTDAPALPLTTATVLKVEGSQDDGGDVVEIQLPRDDVPQVAAASAAGAVTLVLVPAGG